MNERDLWKLSEPKMTDSGFVERLTTNEEADGLRDILLRHPGSWVTFRRDADLTLDGPYSNEITPLAVYGLDTDKIAADAGYYISGKYPKKEMRFHHYGYVRRPVAVAFSVEGRIVSSATYDAFEADWERLRQHVPTHRRAASAIVERWRPKREYDCQMAFRALLWMTEHTADALVGAELWGDTYKRHPDKPRVWSELLRGIGIDALEDRHNSLTGDCRDQIVTLNPGAITVLAAYDNPASATPRPEISAGWKLP